ncbi:MAG TPA: hypothetical protein VLF91_02490 [Candidatus Saccharimonadales bacterium]|nr:hypothetical protein [Candidatus Saccharimonadales bacterium]
MTEMQVKTFGREIFVPDLDDELRVTDPEQQRLVLRELGQHTLADNFDAYQQAERAAQLCEEITAEDWRLYADYFSNAVPLVGYLPMIPVGARSFVRAAQRSAVFTNIMVRTVPDAGETLVVGIHESALGMRYFKIAQWGKHLTTIEELRKRRRFFRVFSSWVQSVVTWRPEIQWPERQPKSKAKKGKKSSRGPLHFGLVTMLLAGGAWCALLLHSWWLLAMAMVAAMSIACGYAIGKTASSSSVARQTALAVIAANLLGVVGLGVAQFYHWNTVNRTERVLVCGTKDQDDSWAITTSGGDMTLDPGIFNGTFYPKDDEAAAKALVGNYEILTVHGHWGNQENLARPFVTNAVFDGKGSCG